MRKTKATKAAVKYKQPLPPPFEVGHVVQYIGTARWGEKVTKGSNGEVIASVPGHKAGSDIYHGYNVIDFPEGRVGVDALSVHLFTDWGRKQVVDKTLE